MPKELEELIKKLITEGKTKEEAHVIATSTLDGIPMGIKDAAVAFNMSIDERTGFMNVDAVIARTGIQKYLASEVGDEGNDIVGVFRPVEEVTHQESLDSFTNVPVTDNHPTEMVDIENYTKYAKGSISSINVVQLGDGITALKTQLVITDKALIESIRNGKKELSVGYENILVQKDGIHNGEKYTYVQTDIRANHVAVVDAGRCGGMCKLMIDKSSMSDNLTNEGETVMKIVINGVEFEVAEEVAAEITRLMEAVKAASEKSKDEGAEKGLKEAVDKLQATVDVLTTSKAKLQTQLDNSASVVDASVEAKLAVLTMAKDAGVDVKTTDTVLAIKQAIVKSLDVDIEGKTELYLDACIDMNKKDITDAAAKRQSALDSIKKVGNEYKSTEAIDVKAIGDTEMGAE